MKKTWNKPSLNGLSVRETAADWDSSYITKFVGKGNDKYLQGSLSDSDQLLEDRTASS